jgi:copper chaperone
MINFFLTLKNKSLKFLAFMFIFCNFISITNAAETLIASVNGMMCIKCQNLVTKALIDISPAAKVKVSWPEGVAIVSFKDKANIDEEQMKDAIENHAGFEVVKVEKVLEYIEDPAKTLKFIN